MSWIITHKETILRRNVFSPMKASIILGFFLLIVGGGATGMCDYSNHVRWRTAAKASTLTPRQAWRNQILRCFEGINGTRRSLCSWKGLCRINIFVIERQPRTPEGGWCSLRAVYHNAQGLADEKAKSARSSGLHENGYPIITVNTIVRISTNATMKAKLHMTSSHLRTNEVFKWMG